MQQNQGQNQNQNDDIAEAEDEGIGVGTSKQSKIMIILLITIFVSAVIYFVFLKEPSDTQEPVNTNEIIISGSGQTPSRDSADLGFDPTGVLDTSITSAFPNTPDTNVQVPALPEIPTLPEEIKQQIAAGVEQKDEETFTKEEVDRMIEEKMKQMMEEQMAKLANQQTPIQTPEIQQPTPITPVKPQEQPKRDTTDDIASSLYSPEKQAASLSDEDILAKQQEEEAANLAKIQRQRALQERRAAPIFKMSGGAGPANSLPQDSDAIILSYTDAKLDIQSKAPDVMPTQVTDLTRVILQGKVISAVLETAIDTDLAATVRAVITRDVYAEEGKNILIPRGSRVVGTYATNVASGQTRVTINWNRIIRVDGMSLNIASIGADRLGRAGVQGDLDNRYAQQLANSFLSSVLSVGTSLAVEKMSGSTGITNTISSLTGETTTTSGKASDYALISATQDFMDDAQDIVDDIAEQKPVIRVPQGEKIIIMVTQDVTLPIFKRGS